MTLAFIHALTFPLHDAPEVIWALTGMLIAIVVVVSLDSIALQVLGASAKKSSPARRWDHATTTVRGLLDGNEAAMAAFSKLLVKGDTRQVAIDALTNAARMRPEAAAILREREHDVAEITDWVTGALGEKDPGQRSHACEVVATLRLRSCRGLILAATTDTESTVRVSACRALSGLDPEEAVGVLLGLVDTEGPWVSGLLSEVVARLPESATAALVRRAKEWGASPALVRLLANSPSAEANDVFLAALNDSDPEVRSRSAEAISPTTPGAVAALAAMLTDANEGSRLSAVRTLARAGAAAPMMSLVAALSDNSRVVRFAAAEGIAALPGGRDILARSAAGTDAGVAEAAELALWRVDGLVTTKVVASALGAETSVIIAATIAAGTGSLRMEAGNTESATAEAATTAEAVETEAVETEPVERPTDTKLRHRTVTPTPAGERRAGAKPTVPVPTRSMPRKTSVSKSTGRAVQSRTVPTIRVPSTTLPTLALLAKPVLAKPVLAKTAQEKNTHQKTAHETSASERTEPVTPELAKATSGAALLTGQRAEPNTTRKPLPNTTPRSDVEAWMVLELRKLGGEAPSSMIREAGLKLGLAERTMDRARAAVAYSRRVGFCSGSVWVLREELREEPVALDSASRVDVEAWLVALLRARGGEAPSRDIRELGRSLGFSERTMERARGTVADSRRVGFGAGALWVLREKSHDLVCSAKS